MSMVIKLSSGSHSSTYGILKIYFLCECVFAYGLIVSYCCANILQPRQCIKESLFGIIVIEG